MSNTAIQKREQESINVPDRQQQPQTWYTPLVDVIETDEAFVFEADLPGVKPADVDISFDKGTLVIQASVAPRQQGVSYLWQEYGVGGYYRSFAIDTPVDPEGIRAQLKKGVLELYVPKAKHARPKKIEVRSA